MMFVFCAISRDRVENAANEEGTAHREGGKKEGKLFPQRAEILMAKK